MTVTIQLAATLRDYCQPTDPELILAAATVRDALEQLEQSHPRFYQSICDETGAVRRHIHLFVNNTFVHDGTQKDIALGSGDVLSIMTAVSGG